jgi:hypothetical protein
MRHSMRALLSGLVVCCCCCQAMAQEQEKRSGLWIFGQKAEIKVATPADVSSSAVSTDAPASTASATTTAPQIPLPQTPATTEEERRWMLSSQNAKMSWPRLQAPKLKMPPSPFPSRSDLDRARNSWVEKSPDPAKPSPLQAMKDGAGRFKKSTREAWDKTVDALKPGEPTDAPSSRVASTDKRPFWKRMFFVEPSPPQGPQTMSEWIAQDRIDP